MVNQPEILGDLVATHAPQAGDICVLLEPAQAQLPELLKAHLKNLQQQFGGTIPGMIHITAQVFEPPKDASFNFEELLTQNLESAANQLQPFPLKASSYFPIHLTGKNLHILKWSVSGSNYLENAFMAVDLAGSMAGMTALYQRKRVCAWVTALRGIKGSMDMLRKHEVIPIPVPLFYAGKFYISRILSSGEFEKIGEVYF